MYYVMHHNQSGSTVTVLQLQLKAPFYLSVEYGFFQ